MQIQRIVSVPLKPRRTDLILFCLAALQIIKGRHLTLHIPKLTVYIITNWEMSKIKALGFSYLSAAY